MPERKPTNVTPITANGVYYRIWDGGRGVITVGPHSGTGTLTLSVLNSSFTTLDTAADYTTMGSDTTFTAAGNGQFFLPAGKVIGIVVTSASGLSTIVEIDQVGE